MSVPEMSLNEMPQRFLQTCRVHQIAALLRGPDVVDHHVAHQQLAARPADQGVAQLEGDDLRQMLVLGDRANLVLAELAQPEAVLERQHRRLRQPIVISNLVQAADGSSLTWVKARRLVVG
jgi:hypothetical protein